MSRARLEEISLHGNCPRDWRFHLNSNGYIISGDGLLALNSRFCTLTFPRSILMKDYHLIIRVRLHAQGYALLEKLLDVASRVRPARAGIYRHALWPCAPLHRSPCTRRNIPDQTNFESAFSQFALHAQGYTPTENMRDIPIAGRPVPTGI